MNPKKLFIITLFAAVFITLSVNSAYAVEEQSSRSSAKLAAIQTVKTPDVRAKILREYLEKYNSPLADNAETLVKAADENNIDWRLVAAISGTESTFAHELPYNSYNAWGWGIYGDHVIYFKSYDDAINTISKGLRENYINKLGTDDVYAIGRMYAASPAWAGHVSYFLNQIEDFKNQHASDALSISI